MDKIKLIIGLMPALIQLIKAIELALPEKGQGATKLAMVKEILIFTDSITEAAWPAIEAVINALVKGFNISGVFKN